MPSDDAWTPGPTGVAYSGEVEDFTVNMLAVDYGDAPDSYSTLHSSGVNGGARHLMTGPVLGQLIDHDQDGQPSDNALGDDLDNDGSGVIPVGGIVNGSQFTDRDEINPFILTGSDNDFRIYRVGDIDGPDFTVEFDTNAPAGVSWDGFDTLTVSFVEGNTTTQELIDLINAEQAADSPLEAALTDDLDNDDEDGFDLDGAVFVPGQWASLDVTVTNLSGATYLKGWIDYYGERDGTEGWEALDAIQWGDGTTRLRRRLCRLETRSSPTATAHLPFSS